MTKYYLLPYEEISDICGFITYIRPELKNYIDWQYRPAVWCDNYGNWWHNSPITRYTTKTEAMMSLDDSLTKNCVFITKEKAEKLMLLL